MFTGAPTEQIQLVNRPSAVNWLPWLPIAVGVLLLFVPTWYDLSHTLWNTDENGHGPIILLIVIWYMWTYRAALLLPPSRTRPFTGGLILAFGLFMYLVGRSQQIINFETLAEVPILLGLLLMIQGTPTVLKMWFPLFFLVFLTPIPWVIVDVLTGSLKHYVSVVVTRLLFAAGFPIAHSGVELYIGYYQLLVADACSGLNSMFSLSALGILYMHVMQRTSFWRNAILLATIIPVAFTSNVIRVMFLVLLTYYYGNAVGQSYLHQFAGLVMFTASIINHFMIDNALGIPFPDSKRDERASC